MNVMERIHRTYLVPVVVIDDAKDAVPAAKALLAGGVDVMEITLRTAAGLDAIAAVSGAFSEMLVGAGTVLSLDQCREAIARGAKFIVSPGYDPAIVAHCQAAGVDVLPGCVTPTEITVARNAGLRVVKFFPASVYGGLKAMKALAGPFTDMSFVPTGGVNGENLSEYVTKEVFAIGGGWLCERKRIREQDFAAVTAACVQARETVERCR